MCRGFDQLIEVVFLPTGEIIGSQTWYQDPSGGIRDSLTHLVPGGLYPQRWRDEQPMAFTSGADPLPAILLMPATAHSGLALYQGNLFPPPYHGTIFSAEFNTRKVVVHRLTRAGATFHAETEDFLTTDDPDFRPSDVIEDADGSLLVIDTGSWYVQHCPTGRMRTTSAPGAIYRIRPTAAAASPDPRGLHLDFDVTVVDLVHHLHDPRPAVRERAIGLLVARGPDAVAALSAWLRSTDEPDIIATSALWALARINDDAARRELRRTLTHPNATFVATAARALALHPDQTSASALEELLDHSEVSVRMAAAESLSVCGRPESAVALVRALETSPDRMLEHALIYALHSNASLDSIRPALAHPNPQVQKAALLLLGHRPHDALTADDVLTRLGSDNAQLRRVAQFCLAQHIDWALDAAAFVRKRLHTSDFVSEDQRAVSELLVAFQDTAPFVSLVGDSLVQPETVVGITGKVLLLDFLARTTRVPWPDIWSNGLHSALTHPARIVRLKAILAVATTQTNAWDTALQQIATDSSEDAELRVEALSILAVRHPDLSPPAWDLLTGRLAPTNPLLARLRAAEVLVSARPPQEILRHFLTAADNDPSLSPSLVLSAARRSFLDPATTALLFPYLERCVRRGFPLSENESELIIRAAPAATEASVESLRRAVKDQARAYEALLRRYRPLLTGGDPAQGRALFFDKAGCYACHQVGNQGRPGGLDLTKLGAIRSPDDILESVLLPSATFAQGYDTFVADLTNGDSVTGNLAGETAESVTLRSSTGTEIRIPRDQIDSLERSPLSLMPEGLLQALTDREAADLLAFLLDLR